MKANAPLRARSAIRLLICRSPALLLFALAILPLRSETRVLVIAGPTDHPPGTHEVTASARLLGHCLGNLDGFPDIRTEVSHGWPQDDAVLEKAATLVFIGDLFPPVKLPDPAARLTQLGRLMDRGTGMVCVHYATGLEAKDVAADGSHPLLTWVGGYFATRCAHHQSIAKIFNAATITPAAGTHPVCQGWQEFTFRDEPYINNYFGPDGNQPAPNVTVFATSLLPPEAPKREPVAWGIKRPGGGRGFAVVMPHFYQNWTQADLRTLILNGIVWTAKRDLPAGGVKSAAPDLAAFAPDSIEPKPRPKPAKVSPAPVPAPNDP